MTDAKTFHSKPLIRLIAGCCLPLILSPLLQYLAVASFGSTAFLWFEMFIILPFAVALLTLVNAPFLLLVPRLRSFAIRLLIAAAVFAAATVIGLRFGGAIRMAAFHSLAERSTPLVRAIRAYESRHGTPPPGLPALVPEFLPSIPITGMAAYPQYQYHVGQKAAHYDGNPWVLVVDTPSGGINFDTFMYFPRQNYPKTGYGGSLERISDWVYVHE
jgi:hypothetical protein